MQIVHDRSHISDKGKELIAHGFAAESLHCLRLSFVYTEEERAENLRFSNTHTAEERVQKCRRAAKVRSDTIYQVVQAVAGKYVCYQFDPKSRIPYDSDQWDLFFWCNCFSNTEHDTGLQGNDYSYVTLTFNAKHPAAKQQSICDGVLGLIEQQFCNHPNLHVAIQHSIRVDEKKVDDTIKLLLPSMLERPCFWRGKEGKLIQTSEGVFFRKKYARKYGYRLSDTDLLILAWKQMREMDAA